MHSLIKKYGVAAVEDACATAFDIGVYEYRFVRRYLERCPHPQMFLRQIDPLIRELTEYRDFAATDCWNGAGNKRNFAIRRLRSITSISTSTRG